MENGKIILVFKGLISLFALFIGGALAFYGDSNGGYFTIGMMLVTTVTTYWLPKSKGAEYQGPTPGTSPGTVVIQSSNTPTASRRGIPVTSNA